MIDPRRVTERELSRRRFMGYLLAAGASPAVIAACSSDGAPEAAPPTSGVEPPPTVPATTSPPPPSTTTTTTEPPHEEPLLADRDPDRVLVIVDLIGGNDGLSTLIPAGIGRYFDNRRDTAIDESAVLGLDDEYGVHPALGRLHGRGLSFVEGVGPAEGNLSHFAMRARWEQGDIDGRASAHTGFFGRVVDQIQTGGLLTGLSLAGNTPHLLSETPTTLPIAEPEALSFLIQDNWDAPIAYRDALLSFGGSGIGVFEEAAAGYQRAVELARQVSDITTDATPADDLMLSDLNPLGEQLKIAADAIVADLGVRVVYTQLGDFDTHNSHLDRHSELMAQLDAGVEGFIQRMESAGLADKVLVATISEFGRRFEQSGSGLDHGSASTMMLAGPVPAGRFGEAPSLDDLDADGNLRTTVTFDRYLATLCEGWLGVAANFVLPGNPRPLPVFT